MRAVLAGELDTAKAWTSDVYVKLEVQNASGTWKDVGAKLGSSWIVNASWGEHIDNPVSQATFQLIQKIGSASLAPLMSASTLNVDDIGNYAPLLNIGRLVRASTATMAAGVALDVANYRKIFEGRIDHVSSVDGEYDYGPITIRCSDLGGWLMDQQIETEGTEYGTTPGTALQTVLQSVVNDNLPSGDPAVTVVKQSPSTFLVTTWNQGATKVMEALRTLVLDSVGEDIRYRFNSSHNSTLQWFNPDRTRVTVDATFTANQYVLRTLDLHLRDIRNKGELPYTVAATGLTGVATKSSAASISKYRTRFFRLPESKMLTTAAEAQTVIDTVVSDLAEPPAEAMASLPYSWYVQLYDRYTFAANNQQYDQAQTFGVVGFQHSINDGRGTTELTVTARIVGAYAEWNRRISGAVAPEMRILNFREVTRTATTVTLGWESRGIIAEFWLYLSTPSQPVGTDPYLALTGVPTARLTPATTSYEVTVPRQGLVTYGRLIPMSSSAQRGHVWDFTVQPGTAERLIQRASGTTTSATTVTVSVAVANPTTGSDITITPVAVGCTVAEGAQTILAASVTDDIATTGTKTFTVTRPAFQAGTGRITFTATSTDRLPDADSVDIPAQERDTVFLAMRARVTASTATTATVRVAVADPYPQGAGSATITYTETGGTGTAASPASGGTVTPAATLTEAAGTYIDYTVTRPNFGTGTRRITFTATASNRTSDSDAVDVPAVEQDTNTIYAECNAAVSAVSATTVTVTVTGSVVSGTPTVGYVGATGSATLSSGNAAGTYTYASGTSWVFNRGAFGTGPGQAQFRAITTGAQSDDDFVEIPEQGRDTQPVQVRILRVSESGSNMVVRVAAITPNAGATCTVAYDAGGLTVSPASGGTFTSTTDFATTAYIDYTITRPAYTGTQRRVAFTVSAPGFVSGADGVDVPPMGRDLVADKVVANEINVTNLAAINADLGTVTAGHIKNSGNTAAIRMSGTAALPSTNYIDFTATTTALFMKAGGIEIKANGEVRGAGDVVFGGTVKYPTTRHHEVLTGAHGDNKTYAVSYDVSPTTWVVPQTYRSPTAGDSIEIRVLAPDTGSSVSGFKIRAVSISGPTSTASTNDFAATLNGTPSASGITIGAPSSEAFCNLASANTTSTTYKVFFDVNTTSKSGGGLTRVTAYKNDGVSSTTWSQVGQKSYDDGVNLTGERIDFTAALAANYDVRLVVTYSGGTPTTNATVVADRVDYDEVTGGVETHLTNVTGGSVAVHSVEPS